MKERRGGVRSRCCCCTGDQSSTDIYATIAPKNMSPRLPSHLPHLLCSLSTKKKSKKKQKKKCTTRWSSIILCRRAQILCVVLKFIEERKTIRKNAMTRASELECFAFLSFVCLFVAHFCFPCIFGVFYCQFSEVCGLGDHPSTRGMSQIWLEIKEESKFYFL
jgi:hypothetical protein